MTGPLLRMPLPRVHALGALLLLVATLLVFGQALRAGFTMDDNLVLEGHPLTTQGLAGLGPIFTSPYLNLRYTEADAATEQQYRTDYRPVPLASFALATALHGNNLPAHKAANLLCYWLACIAAVWSLRPLLRQWVAHPRLAEALAWAVGLLFLLHPVHSELPLSLKNRDEILALLFGFGALGAGLRYLQRGRPGWLALVLGLLLLGFLSKLSTLAFVGLLPTLGYLRVGWQPRKLALLLGLGLIAVAITAGLQAAIVPSTERSLFLSENPLAGDAAKLPLLSKLAYGLRLLLYYLKLLVWPYPLAFYYGYNTFPLVGWGSPLPWLSAFVHLSLAAGAGWGLWQRRWWAAALLLVLAPVPLIANVATPVPGIVAERLYSLPPLGLAFLTVMGLSTLWQRDKRGGWVRYIGLGLVAVLLLLAIAYNRQRSQAWQSTLMLAQADVQHWPASFWVNWMLADQLLQAAPQYQARQAQQRAIQQAKAALLRATALDSSHADSWQALAGIYQNAEQPDSLRWALSRAVQARQNDPELYAAYALGLAQAGRADSARVYLQKLQSSAEPQPRWLLAVTNIHLALGEYDKALAANELHARRYPQDAGWRYARSRVLLAQGDSLAGMQMLERYLALPGAFRKPLAQQVLIYYQEQALDEEARSFMERHEAQLR